MDQLGKVLQDVTAAIEHERAKQNTVFEIQLAATLFDQWQKEAPKGQKVAAFDGVPVARSQKTTTFTLTVGGKAKNVLGR